MWSDSKTVTAAPERLPKTSSPFKIRSQPVAAALGLLLTALPAVLMTACAATPPPVLRTPGSPVRPADAATPDNPGIEAAPEPAPVKEPEPDLEPLPTPAPERGDRVVILDPGGEEETSTRGLVEAARAEKERRAHAGPSVMSITDKNLKQYATGQLTVADPKAGTKGSPVAADPEVPLRDEQYWRSRALEVRLRWRHSADAVKEMELAAVGWRRRFYAERDPNVRSGQIKPEWDRVLDRLEDARAEVDASKQELSELLEEGRTAGALPGWLREGVDEEPKDEPAPSNIHEVIAPPVATKDGQKP